MPVRTGYEQVIGQRAGDTYAVKAKDVGEVTFVGPEHLVVSYASDDLPDDHVSIGRYYGKSAGLTIPHDIVTDMKVGDAVKRGDVVAFNTGFFERDVFNPTDVVWKSGILVTVALVEDTNTIEDSSAISEDIARKMRINTSNIREIVLRFDQGISNLVNLGESVESESILCFIEDALTAQSGAFAEEVIDSLSVMGRNSPRAKYDGTIAKIDVIYNGQLEDMTDSMRQVAMAADKRRAKRVKQLNNDDAATGLVSDIEMDTMIVRIHIDSNAGAADGDKVVFGNQLKSVVCRVMTGRNETKDGTPIGALFGAQSVEARQVLSPLHMGTTNVLMSLLSKRSAKAYRES